MKRLLVTISFLFILLICAPSGAPPAFSETLRVVNLAPMSGGAAAWGIAGDRGIRLAVDEINGSGGIKVGKETYTIQVIRMDHRYVPGEAMAAAKRAVDEGIKFIFGMGGGIYPAVRAVVEENKVIYIASMGGGAEFTNAKNPHTFRTMSSDDMAYMLYLPRFVKMMGPIKGGFVFNNDEGGRAGVRISKRVITERNLPIEQIPEFVERDVIDLSPVVTRLLAKGVNLILIELTPAQAATFVKQAWELGYKGRMGMLRGSFDLGTLLKAAGKEAVEGFITGGSNWPLGASPSANFEKLRSKYLSLYKEDLVLNAFTQYAAVEFWAKAVERAGTTDSERVLNVLYDLKTETVLGPTFMVGKSLGYGIKTQMSYASPFCEIRDGQLKLIDKLLYEE